MRSTFSILYYINRGKIKADGTTTILCRITIDGKKSVFSTGYYCNPCNWDAKSGEVKDARTNNLLIALRAKMETSYEKMLKETGMVTAEMLKNEITCAATIPTTLLKTGEEERERLRIRAEVIESTSSYRQSKSSQAYLHEYLLSLGTRDIAFEDITEDFGWGYKFYLKTKGCGAGHINHCLTWLNRLIYIAVDREIIRFNPLADVSYEKKPDYKLKHISRAELQRIMEQPMPEKRQELTRRIFIFSAFTGLSYVDVKQLYPSHIGTTADGRRYIRINRKKTDVESFVPLHPIAEQILSLYNTTNDEEPIFPLPNRNSLWYCIHEIGVLAGVKENLSYHASRHSFGTLMLSAGVPIESISKMMGHTSIKTTQGYARVTDDKISEDMDRLMERRKAQPNNKKANNTK
ncbi:site-specific integrase [Bacteroides uniformis]|uniref:site-specific integrase n=1 Tax=Bacteroides uniformis TaxID=820 RepID=UPI0022E2141D|nr:site-specific integrase [Bacteroides uniformis]